MGGASKSFVKAALLAKWNPNCSFHNIFVRLRASVKIVASPTIPARIVPRLFRRVWVFIPLLAVAFISSNTARRIQRVRYVSGLAGWSLAGPAGAAISSAESAGQLPTMIISGDGNDSYEWIDQTKQMFARGELRVRRVDYENAPFGHDVNSASPYRWWLGLVAWISHRVSGQAFDPSVERASLFADPLLNLLLLVSTTLFVSWQFGALPTAVFSIALATLYPLSVGFLPGAPNDQGLKVAFGVWSVLPILAGINAGRRQRYWFFSGGVVGGLGLWIGVASEVPVLVGIGLGALIAAFLARQRSTGTPAGPLNTLAWRTWAIGGAAASLSAYMIEFFPSHMGTWELRVIHPIYGLSWLGLGEALTLATARIQRTESGWRIRETAIAALAAVAVSGLPIAMRCTHNEGFLAVELSMLRLTRLPNGVAAQNLLAWIIRDGLSTVVWATVLPVLLIGPAIWLIVRHKINLGDRISVAIAIGPVLVALGFATRQLSWWNGFDAALLALAVAVSVALRGPASSRLSRIAWLCLVLLVLIPGATQAVPYVKADEKNALEGPEVLGLIERDLGRWLAIHASSGGGVILAPADTTIALYYYGGLRGLGTLDWENRDGLQGAVRIASATTPEEALDLIDRRGVTLIVIPSWDSQLDTFARLGLGQLKGSFAYRLHSWALPTWLRPVPYPLPIIGGFEGQSIVVLERIDGQDEVTLMSRMAEYFVETDNLDLAASAGQELRRFPADLGALVARARVHIARGESDAFAHTIDSLLSLLSDDRERTLAWDRRVSLAVVLAQGKHIDRARAVLQRCLAEVDDAKLRSLTTGSLYHLQVLANILGMEITDPRLHQLALDLLPSNLRSRFDR